MLKRGKFSKAKKRSYRWQYSLELNFSFVTIRPVLMFNNKIYILTNNIKKIELLLF